MAYENKRDKENINQEIEKKYSRYGGIRLKFNNKRCKLGDKDEIEILSHKYNITNKLMFLVLVKNSSTKKLVSSDELLKKTEALKKIHGIRQKLST